MQVSLVSPEFLGLALAVAIALAVLGGLTRQLIFLAANLAFIWAMLLGTAGAIWTIAFCLLGYGLTAVVFRWPRWGFRVAVTLYVLLFVYLRSYTFVKWVLPESALAQGLATVGLSFLFFKVIHVMIEARSGTLGPFGFLTYLNYCLNFSVFMMGPIQRYQDFEAQWTGRRQAVALTFEAHLDAVLRILVGLVKAYVIAEWIAPHALTDSPDLLSLPHSALLLRIYAFYFFLYFNFSGYCDVVIGIGSLLGVRPPENFDKPFLARNISDFWMRFHRSLTQWLTDFVFSPTYKWALGQQFFASRPLLAVNLALMLTMTVSGLWHGATPGFLLFGLVHGLYFVVFRSWETLVHQRLGKQWLRRWRRNWFVDKVNMLLVLSAVAFSMIFFTLGARRGLELFGRLMGL